MPSPADAVSNSGRNRAQQRPCPSCGSQTPVGFQFCQQCGTRLPEVGAAPGVVSGETGGGAEAVAATLAAPERYRGGRAATPAPAADPAPVLTTSGGGHSPARAHTPVPDASSEAGPAWGALVCVNRDGSDGRRFPLVGEYITIGRAADISFADDRFLARVHARFEQDAGPRVVPVDVLNGVFRRITGPTPLVDGSIMLVGREVLRYETIDEEERSPLPLVRHGVALFGSPPRQPWGRLVQLLPSGGVRDVRHLSGDEIIIGREEGDLVFRDDAFLSRAHACLRLVADGVVLDDLSSSNGTFVRLPGPTRLGHADHLRLGDQLLRFER